MDLSRLSLPSSGLPGNGDEVLGALVFFDLPFEFIE